MACMNQSIRRPHPSRRRLRGRRHHERGVALVEAAFMLPMFVILWYASLYVHSLGSKYIGINTLARQDTWQTAMANCGVNGEQETEVLPASLSTGINLPSTGGGDTINAVVGALKNGNIAGALAGFVNTFTAALANAFPSPKGAHFTKTATVSWRVPDLYDHSGMNNETTNLKYSYTVVCNIAPENGSISNVAGAIVAIIESMVHS
jgi:hypothetical protein